MDQTVAYGGTATFTVAATSATTLSYQWYKDGLLILDEKLKGETRSTLILSNVGNSDAGHYFVAVKNAAGTVYSRKARLRVVSNNTPVANNDTYVTPEDVQLNVPAPGILLNDTDLDGDALTALLLANVSNGSLSLNPNGSFTYTPNTNYFGSDSFTYRAADGLATGNVAIVTINITPVNGASPVAINDTYTTPEDVPLIIPAAGVLTNDLDGDGDALTALLLTNVSNGSLTLDPNGSFTYIPNTNYYGSDSFTYRASDGFDPVVAILQQNNSGGDRIEIKEDEGSGAQSFRHGTAGGPAYSVTKIILRLSRKTSTPNDNLNFSIGTGKNSGAIVGSSFAITKASITNTSSGSSFQDYEIAYAAPVGPFTAGTTYYLNLDFAPTGKEVWIEMSGNNAYANGTYYEDDESIGKDMRFQIHGFPHSDIATVTLTVTPVNDAPCANDDSTNTLEDVSVTIPVLANDSDVEGSPLTLTGTSTTNGTAIISGANVVFTPSTNFNGIAVFDYTVSDGTDSATASVTVTVIPVNDAPVANDDTYSTLEDEPLTIPAAGILTNDLDVDGDVLTAVLVSNVSHGNLNLNSDGSFTYMPDTNYFGNDSFTYSAMDGSATGNVATVTINVTPVNDAPIANDDNTNTLEDVSVIINVLDNDSDPDGTPLTLTGTSTTNGTAVISGNSIVFTPSTNFNGVVVFNYTVSDGTDSATASVTVTVTPVNDAPVAYDDTYATLENGPLNVPVMGLLSPGNSGEGILANDMDVEGDPLTAVLVSNVAHGELSLNPDGSFTYTPEADYHGTDSFTYSATDGSATGNVATVSINVTPGDDPPEILSGRMTENGFELLLSGADYSTCVILVSTNHTDWTPLCTNYTASGSVVITDTEAANYPMRFYRAMAMD